MKKSFNPKKIFLSAIILVVAWTVFNVMVLAPARLQNEFANTFPAFNARFFSGHGHEEGAYGVQLESGFQVAFDATWVVSFDDLEEALILLPDPMFQSPYGDFEVHSEVGNSVYWLRRVYDPNFDIAGRPYRHWHGDAELGPDTSCHNESCEFDLLIVDGVGYLIIFGM